MNNLIGVKIVSANNGIYILQTLDGFRVTHAQAIENIYWHPSCCDNPNLCLVIEEQDGSCYHEHCLNCDIRDPEYDQKEEAYLPTVYEYFKDSKVYPDLESAMKRAHEIYQEIMKDDFCPIIEYGIQFINNLEDYYFPAMAIKGIENES